MKAASFPSRHRSGRRGAALVVVRFFIVLITVIGVGFLESSRMDRAASSSHFERMRATNFAREGVESIVATLRRETTDKKRNWISSPGLLIVPEEPDVDPEQMRLRTDVFLSSGTSQLPANIDLALRPPNLNIQTFADPSTPTYLLTDRKDPSGKPREMNLRWVYVRRDGTYDLPDPNLPIGTALADNQRNLPTEQPDLTNKTNPIFGRFAYWADDESSKLNYNLAWSRSAANVNPPAHPTRVSLMALTGMTGSLADEIHHFVTKPDGSTGNKVDYEKIANRFFNSPTDARSLSSAAASVLEQNKFEVTHYNHDPDTTFFNEPRIVLTTQKRWARGRPFLDILKNPGTDTTNGADPGTVNTIDPEKLETVIKKLVNPQYPTVSGEEPGYLQRIDWPMVSVPSSFQQKYFAGNVPRLTAFALNIIDYVRSAESAATLVEPIRGIVDSEGKYGSKKKGSFVADFADGAIRGRDETFKGLTRSLFITEQGVWVSKTPETAGVNAGRYKYKFFTEIHLPETGGVPSVNVASIDSSKQLYLYLYEPNATTTKNADGATIPLYYSETGVGLQGKWFRIDANTAQDGKTVLEKGKYLTLICTAYRIASSRPTTINLRTALVLAGKSTNPTPADPGTPRLEVAPVGQPGSAPNAEALSYKIDAVATAEGAITTFAVDDPRVNTVAKDWNFKGQKMNTFGGANGDRSTLGNPSSATPQQDTDAARKITDAGMRTRAKKGDTANKDGLVESPGELGFIHTGIEVRSRVANARGVPWRTLRLQPNSQGPTVVPDWAFMDLFTVPVNVPTAGEPVFAPHKSSTGGRVNMNAMASPFDMERITPLAAVFLGASKDWQNPNDTVTTEEAFALAGNIYAGTLADGAIKGQQYGRTDAYDSPGEIVEIKGVADNGEASEELVRQIANLITARGNVFSIYSVGQALKQTPNGELVVTAEQRQHVIVERYLLNKGTADTADDSVAIRTVYFRDLMP